MTTIRKRFLTNTDETGRFIVKSMKTGKVYFVEPIDDRANHTIWGDLDPASKSLQGDYGSKYRGSVKSNESLITQKNGFNEIAMVKGSPFSEIERRDNIVFRQIKNSS
ncbi:MAG: hypothetical protein COA58_05085 [Bacteroidetes bacterium]|nr:MAG: hypothetical protein COA58_05085 [Bacteroidota bacterium]